MIRKVQWSSLEIETIRSYLNEGKRCADISRAMNKPYYGIAYQIKKIKAGHIFTDKRYWTKEEDAQFIALYNDGNSVFKIAKLLGKHYTGLYRREKEYLEAGILNEQRKKIVWNEDRMRQLAFYHSKHVPLKEIQDYMELSLSQVKYGIARLKKRA